MVSLPNTENLWSINFEKIQSRIGIHLQLDENYRRTQLQGQYLGKRNIIMNPKPLYEIKNYIRNSVEEEGSNPQRALFVTKQPESTP